MREIRGRRGASHIFLESASVQNAFNTNITDKKHSTKSAYNDGRSDRKESLKWTLKQIYHDKCAFCESSLKNEAGDIEHFRPKNSNKNQAKKCDKTYSYYWLAFSWDNLLPCCRKCNGKKSNCFDIIGNRVQYNDEKLADLHNKIEEYNEQEKPKLLHPEYDSFEDEIEFRKQGRIYSRNKRVQYTIRICHLNRINLRQSREKIIIDFVNDLREQYISFEELLTKHNDFDESLKHLKSVIKKFCKGSQIVYEYSLVRKYIKDDFENFLDKLEIGFEDEEFAKDVILTAFFEFCNERDNTNE